MATLTIADLDNGKRDLETVDAVANSVADTTVTRYGDSVLTLAGALRRLGYAAPVPYVSGLDISSGLTTVEKDGVVYRPDPALVPFTTGAWNPDQWRVVQNTDDANLVYQFSTIGEANAAAATLPEGSAVFVDGVSQGRVVDSVYVEDSGTAAVRCQDYAALRAYRGRSTAVDITAPGLAGRFIHEPLSTAADDGGLVIVGADGRRWVRVGAAVMAAVAPEIFGAVGNGTADDTAAIQKAIDTKRSVVLAQKYRITQPLVFNGQRIVGTGVTINSGTWAMTTINVDGNFPAFTPAGDSPTSADISGLFIRYADTTPTTSAGNDQKIGFAFLNPSFPNPTVANPQLCKISNCLVKGGWRAYDASGGAYLFKLERVWSWSCRMGFRHIGGTTLSMDTCYALFGEQAYFLQGIANCTLSNCAMDQMTVTVTTPQRSAAVFADIPGLNIAGFYSELNTIGVDAGSLAMFINCIGSVSNVTRWREALSSATGQEAYGYRVYGGRLKLSGFAQQVLGEGFLFTGTGVVMSLLAEEGAIVELDVSDLKTATGGSPSLRYGVGVFSGARVVKAASDTSGGADSSVTGVAEGAVAFSPGLNSFTVTGSPVVTAEYRRAGALVYVNIAINPNGGTVASVGGVSFVSGLPVTAVTKAAIPVVTESMTGGNGYINGTSVVMPFFAATSSVIHITGIYAG